MEREGFSENDTPPLSELVHLAEFVDPYNIPESAKYLGEYVDELSSTGASAVYLYVPDYNESPGPARYYKVPCEP